MADSTIDSEQFVLMAGGWGVFPSANQDVPKDGFTGSEHHNVAAAKHPLGTLKQVYCNGDTGLEGYSQLLYVKFAALTAGVAVAAKVAVVRDSETEPFTVTNDADGCVGIPSHVGGFAISAMTDLYYGWIWVGGVCPEQYVSGLGGTYRTDGNVAKGPVTYHDLSADTVGLGPCMDPTGTSTALAEVACGDAYAADA